MRSLLDKALINIIGNFVQMHDLIQQMGWEIIRQESIENPGYRSRLWDFDDTYDVLKNNKGTDAIQGIMLDMSHRRQNLCLNVDTFKNMPNLRCLKFFISSKKHGRLCDLKLPEGLDSFYNKLRYFEWHAYPLQSLPSNFCAEKLVTLRMPCGQFRRLWGEVQNLVNLKEVNLAGCRKLMELPDFSKAQNLRKVDLSHCKSLRLVHPSILSLGTLEYLDLSMCEKIETLESEVHFRFLWYLGTHGCSSLMKFSVSSEEIEFLDLISAEVKELHSSIGRFSKVKTLYVDGYRLENLPKELSRLKSLEKLLLYRCGRVISKQNLHVIFDGLQSLRELCLKDCHHFFELPENLNRLTSLQKLVLDGSYMERLPKSIKHLSGLEILSLKNCRKLQSLPELPSSIIHLEAHNCTLLWTITSNLTDSRPQEEEEGESISFQNSVNLDVEKCIYSFHQYVRELVHGYELRGERVGGRATFWKSNFRIRYPGCRVPEWFTYRAKGASLTFELAQPLNNYSNFLLCVVLSVCWPPQMNYGLKVGYQYYLDDGKHNYPIRTCFVGDIPAERDFNHVYMSIDRGNIFRAIDRVNNQSNSYNCNPKVTLEFYGDCDVFGWDKDNNWLIKECGCHPLYVPDYCMN